MSLFGVEQMLSITLAESDRQIQSKIYRALAKDIKKSFKKNVGKIEGRLYPLVASALHSSPEIMSLSGGGLRFDFGLTTDPANDIVTAILSSIEVDVTDVRATAHDIRGGFVIRIQPTDYNNLLLLPTATQGTEHGVTLPWLEWLLTLGDAIIVANFGVEYGPFGRTGGAHMVVKERPFKVNTLYSGTADDNFITRALGKIAPQIKNVIRSSL